MTIKYLDKDGLTFLWGKLKNYFQPKLVSGTNIKTVNNTSLLGSGNISITGNVTGVKGNSESSYRTGNVNLTADNVGAIPKYTNGNTQMIYRPSYLRGASDNTLDAKINTLRANRLAFLPADQIIIEKTTDGGATWVDAGVADSTKVGLFSETRAGVNIPLLNGVKSLKCGLRITITAMKYNVPSGTAETAKYNYWNSNYVLSTERYNQLKEMYFWVSVNSDTMGIKVERATGANSTNWVTAFDDSTFLMTGWSGNDYLKFGQNVFGGGTTQTTNYWNYRITFMTKGTTASNGATLATTYTTNAQSIMEIRAYGDTWWTAGNEYAANDKLYSHDYLKNVTFPNKVTATGGFSGALTGNVTGNVSGTSANVTGTVAIANGGTGATTATNAANAIFGGLPSWTADPTDDTYFPRQDTGGSASYGKVKFSTVWNYIKGKISSVLGLTATSYGGSSAKVNNHTVDKDVPSDAVFTDTKVTALANHYTPSGGTTTSASGATGTSGTTVQVVTGVTKDAAGHVTGVTSGAATDTTYESKAAASGGTAVSLVTTGEKYTWNNKSSLGLGETSSTAYRGDRGKTAYDHSQSTHARTDATKTEASTTNGNIKINGTETTVYTHPTTTAVTAAAKKVGKDSSGHVVLGDALTATDVGLGNVGNFKAVSTVASQGLSTTEQSNARANIGAGTSSLTLGTTATTAAKGNHSHYADGIVLNGGDHGSVTTVQAAVDDLYDGVDSKQDTLVSGTNIKTINNTSLLGSGNINISGGGVSVLDFYPVGSYYETSDTSFNPNTAWGGTWVLETAGMVHVSGGTGYTVSKANNNSGAGAKDGGSADSIVVSHSHGKGTLSGSTPTLTASSSNFVTSATAPSSLRGSITSSASSNYNFVRVETSGASMARSAPTIASGKAVTISGSTDSEGSSGTGANMQPYINVNRWHRTA